jgi:hypothetical protein
MEQTQFWKKCSNCKNPINFNSTYYVCNVSTCNGERTGYVFCKVGCFEAHVPGARHRDAWAIEQKAPQRRIVATSNSPSNSSATVTTNFGGQKIPREVLVIASRLKEYITARSDYNTSSSVMDVLSDHLRILCDRAIDNARADGRKTVMDRDFEFLKNLK